MNLDTFFDSIEAYVAAAKAKAADLAAKAAEAMRQLAAWMESQAAPTVGAAPVDATRLATCLTECQALVAPKAKGAAVGGPFADILSKILAAILAALKP